MAPNSKMEMEGCASCSTPYYYDTIAREPTLVFWSWGFAVNLHHETWRRQHLMSEPRGQHRHASEKSAVAYLCQCDNRQKMQLASLGSNVGCHQFQRSLLDNHHRAMPKEATAPASPETWAWYLMFNPSGNALLPHALFGS